MPHPISTLGIGHTLISAIPVVAAAYGYVRHRRIDPMTRSGRVYLGGLVLSVFTSFGLSSTGRFNAGHALGILALLAALGGVIAPRLRFLGRLRPYLAAFGLSFSVFLLLVPGINETLTRLPAAHPLADGLQSPVLRGALLTWVAVFVAGVAAQAWLIHRHGRRASRR